MWTLFFVLLGLGVAKVGRLDLGHFTGWFLILLGIPTCTVSAILLLNGIWPTSVAAGSVALVVLLAATALSVVLSRRSASGEDAVELAAAGVPEGSVVGSVPQPA